MNDLALIDSEKRYRIANNNKVENSRNNSDNVPLQIYKTRAKSVPEEDESRDDNVCIATILQRSATTKNKREEAEDEELRLAMQRAWALLDADDSATPESSIENAIPEETKPMVSTNRIQTVPLKTLTTRIYIDDAKNHKVVQLTNLLTTAMVIQYLRKKGLLDSSNDWTLFEIDNDHGVERPFREWEIVLNVLSAWNLDANNALLVKKYSYHYTITSECILQKKIALMSGYLSIEYKKGKWQKRYCFIKDNSIYHAKDDKGSTSSIFCQLATYDVYTLLQPLKISPTPFVFAIRAQDRSNIFEREGDYMRFAAVETQKDLEDWVLSIRCAKSNIQYQQYANQVINPLAPIALEAAEEHSSISLRRHKSLKELDSSKEEPVRPSVPRSESTRRANDDKRRNASSRGLTRNHTVKEGAPHDMDGHLIDCFDMSPLSKGSLLAKEETPEQTSHRHEENNNTLIQIDDRVKFSKGSLLDKKENQTKMTRSKSVREISSTNLEEVPSHRRHVSLKRKSTRKQHDVPLPNNSSNTLLRLDDSPERFHSRELHERHVKPLLNFDEKPLRK